ncbi:toxin-antitoxin system antitoxin subunit [Tersicoccus sp. MR15.9]|uniref:FitA-like ribbon-helix-helix domain-containing protein n=1 Tax=Tersicoccus mangrovi TaxID=3121635 RepID=UPI002FE68D88
MSTITVRKLADATHDRLRERAAKNGRSVEAEVRDILDNAVGHGSGNILTAVHEQFDGRHFLDLEPIDRPDLPRSVDLG